DRYTAHGDRLEDRVRAQITKLPDVPHHLVQPRHRGRRWELPGDRPARLASHRPQPALPLEIRDLDDRPVDLEVELSPALLPLEALLDDRVLIAQQADVAIDAKAVLAQPLERFPVGREREALVGHADLVAPDRERPVG